MQTIRLTDHNDPLFEMVWQLYTQSFPLSEQRTIEHQCTAFKSDLYHFDIYLEGEQLLGLIGYWRHINSTPEVLSTPWLRNEPLLSSVTEIPSRPVRTHSGTINDSHLSQTY